MATGKCGKFLKLPTNYVAKRRLRVMKTVFLDQSVPHFPDTNYIQHESCVPFFNFYKSPPPLNSGI
jgi:hypothetical protein